MEIKVNIFISNQKETKKCKEVILAFTNKTGKNISLYIGISILLLIVIVILIYYKFYL